MTERRGAGEGALGLAAETRLGPVLIDEAAQRRDIDLGKQGRRRDPHVLRPSGDQPPLRRQVQVDRRGLARRADQ